MCGRYTLYQAKDLAKRYNLATKPTFKSSDNYNVSPRQHVPGIIQQGNERKSALMEWGYQPPWSKDAKGFRPINTVSETAWEKNMWKHAMKEERCLIPARGFYEWLKIYEGDKIIRKEPYYIRPEGLDIFSFAGIYSVFFDVEGRAHYSFSILTTSANKQMEPIHNRMPVILTPDQESVWLEPSNHEPEQLAELLVPFQGKLEIYRVSEDVNSPRNNDKHLVEPVK